MARQLSSYSLLAATCLAFLLIATSQGSADIFRRVDADGVVHYTNVAPRKGGWQRIVRSRKKASKQSEARAHQRRSSSASGDPGRLKRYEHFIGEASQLYQLPAAFIRAVMRVESNFFADVVSHKGAMGLMQLMPQTANSMGVRDPFDPRENILGGARFLRILANQYQGDMVLTLAAYNAGHGAVQRYRGVPPFPETRRYVKRVMGHYNEYRTAQP